MKKVYLIILLQIVCFFNAKAQEAAMPFSPGLDVFNPVTGTVIDAPFADDFNYQNIPIGFDFNYAGNSFDTMVVSTNGFISFDNIVLNNFIFYALNTNYNNVISPFSADLKNNLSQT